MAVQTLAVKILARPILQVCIGCIGHRGIVVAATLGSVHQRFGTLDSHQLHVGIVRILKPVESEVASTLQLRGQLRALGGTGHSSVARAPAVVWSIPLVRASVEYAHSTTGYLQVKVIGAQVTAGVAHLNHHLLARHWAGGEGQLVARTAPGLEKRFGDQFHCVCE